VNCKKLSRRTALAFAAAAAVLPATLLAQDSRPIEWVVGYAAGGGSDAVARTVAEAMGKTLGQPIVINNKPGAATNIAAGYVASAKDNGHLLFTADFATLAANPWLFAKLPYNAEKDFIPVGMLARFPLLLVVSPNVPARVAPWPRRGIP
jgi:tripartite-type tricarboxylate transporter receptor subunit TctC